MNRLLSLPCLVAAVAVSGSVAQATVSLGLSGGYLKAGISGTVVPYNTGLLMLVASTADSAFDPITTSSLFNVGSPLNQDSDDYVLFKAPISGDGNNTGTAEGGEFQQAIMLSLNTAFSQGDALQLYWFPSLTSTSNAASEGTGYGAYRSTIANSPGAADADGSPPWFLPADGTSGYNLLFLTSDAASAINTASSGTQFGATEFSVAVPEPSAAALLAATLLTFCARRQRRLSSRLA
jgi:hypothetical protein